MYNYPEIRSQFRALHGVEPLGIRAPGRINLIGEHTDYNMGFVMPAAIDKEIFFAIAATEDDHCSITSLDYGQTIRFAPDEIQKRTGKDQWANYPLGILLRMQDMGYRLGNFHCMLGSNIPTGAGLSSSAALECGFLFGLDQLNQWRIPRRDMALVAQWSENNFVGARTGIMDQFASLMSRKGQVMQIDCRSLECNYAPLPLEAVTLILLNSNIHHSLASSEYNVRRQECFDGVEVVRRSHRGVESLRDVSKVVLEQCKNQMSNAVYKRCRYIVEEDERVEKAAAMLRNNQLGEFGALMFETHRGLSKLFEVSCPELDFLVERARGYAGVLGARLMGGGFGGCTINLLKSEVRDGFVKKMQEDYHRKYHKELPVYEVSLVEGCGLVPES